jgi:hypothetical protein
VKKRLVFLLLLHRSLCYGRTGTHTFHDRLEEEEEEEEATIATIPNGRTERDSLSLSASASEKACCANKLAAHQEIDTHFTRLSENNNRNSNKSRRRTQTD